MTTLTIGRVGIDVTLNSPGSFSMKGDALSIGGPIRVTSVADMKTIRQQLAGHVASPWERVIPVTWSLDSTVDGFYTLDDASVEVPEFGYRNGFASFDASLTKLPTGGSSWAECSSTGADRSGIPGGVTASTWHAIPSTATAIDADGASYQFTRTGPAGSVKIATSATKFYSADPRFYLPPASWYDMAATIKVGGAVVVGRQSVPDATTWELSNGLMKIAPKGTSSTLLNLTPLSGRAGAAYGTAIGIKAGYYTAGAISAVTTASTVTILRNTPEECAVRLLCYIGTTFTNIDIALRRGSLFATVTFSGDSAQWGIETASVTAMTSQTGGMYATTGGATTLVVSSAKTFTTDLVNGKLYLTAAGVLHDLAIGCTDESGGAATNPDRRTDVRDQFFAATAETQMVIGQ